MLCRIFAGVQYITANKNSEPTSYMTCMVGPPLDGERCKIRSYMSVDKDLIIEGFRMPGRESEVGPFF